VTRTTALTLIVTLASTVAAPTITSGATYWVAKTGSDSNSCSQAQSQSTPRLTINEGLKCLAGGDTLYILPGTYNEKIESRAGTPSVPSGRSWTNMTTISAAPGSELKVILRPDSADHVVYLLGTHRYINFNGLVLDGSNTSYTGTKAVMCSPGDHNCGTIGGLPQFIKWSNSEIKNSHDSGVLGYNDSIFTNMNIHHNGSTHFDHGLYIAGVGNLIQNSQVHHNSGYGVHVYNQPGGVHNNTVRGNVIYSNGQSKRGTGIILSSGSNNQAFNNIIYDNLGGGIQIDWGDNLKAYNNTIYNDPAGCIFIGGSSSNAIVKNNLCSDSGGITDAGTGTIQSNNLTTNSIK
jgi:hypothetical protein